MEFTVSRESSAPPDRIWSVMTDLDGWARVVSGIERVERVDDGSGFAVGTRWRETRTMFGKSSTEEMAVTAVEPGRSYVVESDSQGAHYRSVMSVEPAPGGGGGTIATMTFGARPRSLAARILGATLGRLFLGSTRKALEQDLADITAAAEAG